LYQDLWTRVRIPPSPLYSLQPLWLWAFYFWVHKKCKYI